MEPVTQSHARQSHRDATTAIPIQTMLTILAYVVGAVCAIAMLWEFGWWGVIPAFFAFLWGSYTTVSIGGVILNKMGDSA